MTETNLPNTPHRRKLGFMEDFKQFFLRGLAALLPTLITLWLIVKVLDFLWESLGRHIIYGIKRVWLALGTYAFTDYQPAGYIGRYWSDDLVRTRVVGILLAILLVYVVGVFVGNFIGRTAWRLAEMAVMRIPLVRAIYPAVKQVTDFLLADRKHQPFQGSRVVAVEPHSNGIWSIGLVTGTEIAPLGNGNDKEMVTVFVPSSPTAFSGYVLVVPRDALVELPLTVEQAMRLLVSGGVIDPRKVIEKPSLTSKGVPAPEQVVS